MWTAFHPPRGASAQAQFWEPVRPCPTLTVLLRRTIHDHLRRARPEKNPQWIPANTPPVFPGLRPRIWPHLLRLVTNGNVGQAPRKTANYDRGHAISDEARGLLVIRLARVIHECRCEAFDPLARRGFSPSTSSTDCKYAYDSRTCEKHRRNSVSNASQQRS